MIESNTLDRRRAIAPMDGLLIKPILDRVKSCTQEERDQVGTKACGLLALPQAWTPPFFIISTKLYEDWIANHKSSTTIESTAGQIVSVCQSWRSDWPRGIILRSSAVRETLKDRGAYESIELPADYNSETIASAITRIFSAFSDAGADGSIAIIVQALAARLGCGHVSNELRVAKSINHWMWEIEHPQPRDGRFNSQRAVVADVDLGLRTTPDEKSLIKSLQKVCRWITTHHQRRSHLEWGITKDTLWIYQIDFEDDQIDLGHDPRELLRATDDAPSGNPRTGSPWMRVDVSQETGWSKVDKVKVFAEGRTAYPALYYLTGVEAQRAIDAEYDLAADIMAITHGRAVCRTDCITPSIDRLNLPRTESVSSEDCVAFIQNTTSILVAKGAKPEEVCFILHKFIPAKVAAWAVARPDQQVVLIDTLWGLPDGLQYLPHDTFEVDVRRQVISSEFIRFKPKFLQETSTGEWQLQDVARRYSRTRSLSVKNLREVANESFRIAQAIGSPVQIMWFCDVSEAVKVGTNVPWFMMKPEGSPLSNRTSLAPGLTKLIIKNSADLQKLLQEKPTKSVMVLDPEAILYRDNDFLKSVVDVALDLALPVFMTGSVLSHAYYTLERGGVSVRTDMPSHSRVRQRQKFRKLVRDDIPARILDHGERVDQARIDKTESRTALVIKLYEESQELLAASSPAEVTAELADLTEVVRSLCSATGIEWDDVLAAAEQKRLTRGSFEHNVVLMETSWPRWSDENANQSARPIQLADLAETVSRGGVHLLNFAATASKGADNEIALTNGLKIRVSITKDGVQVSEVDSKKKLSNQLELDFD